MIFDCTLFNGEYECLTIRCEQLKLFDVTHVLVESRNTFTKKSKPLYFADNKNQFKEYNIRHIIVDDISVSNNAWDEECLQRNAIMRGLNDAKDNDIILISDVDEIPKMGALLEFHMKWYDFAALKMDVYWYKFNCLAEVQTWTHPKIMKYSYLKNKTPNEVRESGFDNIINHAGWHFSYLGNEKFISNKLNSYSHIEYNTPEINNSENISKCIENGISLWGESKFEFVPLDHSFPKFIFDNKEKFKHLIHE